ncbi:MAG: ABC transporter permease [Rhizobacter sp.]|nr:ABC transporter permease [Chlorobiales bacterium]
MNITESVATSFASLRANKLRSLLTMLGIIIGVAAVIATVALGDGAQISVKESLTKLGSNLLFVRPGNQMTGGIVVAVGSSVRLKEEDAKSIKQKADYVADVIAEYQLRTQVKFQNKNWNTTIVGTYPSYGDVRNYKATQGRYFTDQELKEARTVAVIGPTVAQNLFDAGQDPLGKTIRLKNINFEIIGVLEEKGQSGFQNLDDQVLVPLSTMQKRVAGVNFVSGITVKVSDETKMDDAVVEVERVMRKSHRLRESQDNDFTIRNQADIIAAVGETSRILSFLLASVAIVALIVGGIGIMNIMLVSVTERTKEIGIRKAIGAKKRDVLLQFLIESLTLSILGGIIGILLGVGVSFLIGNVSTFRTVVSAQSIVVSFIFSAFVGIFFGLYPARKAADANVIDALRYE